MHKTPEALHHIRRFGGPPVHFPFLLPLFVAAGKNLYSQPTLSPFVSSEDKMTYRMISKYIGALVLTGLCLTAAGQTTLSGQKVGLYISSKGVTIDNAFNLHMAQFLKQEEDRSGTGRIKTEFIIRVGTLLADQLQALTQADTVIFLNGDLQYGAAFQQAWDPEQARIAYADEGLQDLDMVVVLDTFEMDARIHNSVYIRSNKMITERIPVKVTRLRLNWADPTQTRQLTPQYVCFDEISSPAPRPAVQFGADNTAMGQYLNRLFSQWWAQAAEGVPGACR
jgi:hypothetical protein